jgi:hypothetical protein
MNLQAFKKFSLSNTAFPGAPNPDSIHQSEQVVKRAIHAGAPIRLVVPCRVSALAARAVRQHL